MTTPLRAIDQAYTAAIHAARDRRDQAERAAAHDYREAMHRAGFRFQEAVTEAQRAHDEAVAGLAHRGAA